MEQQNNSQQELEQRIIRLQNSIDKLNKMFKWTVIIAVILFIVPLVGLLFIIPQFISTVTNYGSLLQ